MLEFRIKRKIKFQYRFGIYLNIITRVNVQDRD